MGGWAYLISYGKDLLMSLTVSPDLLDRARHGDVDDTAFTACIQNSLPYAWQLVSDLAGQLRASGADLADNRVPPPDEAARGQLLRMMASDAMRGAVSDTSASGSRSRTATGWPCSARMPPGPWPSAPRPAPRSSTRAPS
jgi:hypothetical protein